MRRALLALAAVLLLAGCTSDNPDAAQPSADPGVQDVDTALQSCPEQTGDTVEAADALPPLSFDCIGGGTLDLSRAPGVPTVVNVWGSWCGPCREELPLVQQLADEAGDRVQVLGVVASDTLTAADSFAADAGVTFPNGFDQQNDLLTEEGLRGAPYTFFVAADGTLAYTETGAVSSLAELEQLVADHLGVAL
ncbi:TlpA disulfide reductase family protein [Klenkia sp. PcliD-1-E]|uniref:TlpA family protein disulfide reductase n=1 Tax=Klenkia sp. PcliD-1-E TaxID=2954492 RepID=UPI00209825B4|nr:TlpA disulfide reductase family protein [Klenkia sp. PcliD-1-E]MCO7220297.1 TlpA family protein disulfide reductase [Klenkia sp. PcliD-1-E]